MKKQIIAAADAANNSGDIMHYAASQIEDMLYELSHYGYESTVTVSNGAINIGIKYTQNDVMPTITAEVVQEESILYVTPTLTFPTLTFTENDFADNIAYTLDQWSNLGRVITDINRFSFDLNKWEYDAEYDEWYMPDSE